MKLDTALIRRLDALAGFVLVALWLALLFWVWFAIKHHDRPSLAETQDTLYARCEALIATRDSIAMLEMEKRFRWASWVEAVDLAERNRR